MNEPARGDRRPCQRRGCWNLRILAQVLMERMVFDVLVEGAIRTTEANPGHRPRVVRFTRRVRPAP
jgi:hypothetical protein